MGALLALKDACASCPRIPFEFWSGRRRSRCQHPVDLPVGAALDLTERRRYVEGLSPPLSVRHGLDLVDPFPLDQRVHLVGGLLIKREGPADALPVYPEVGVALGHARRDLLQGSLAAERVHHLTKNLLCAGQVLVGLGRPGALGLVLGPRARNGGEQAAQRDHEGNRKAWHAATSLPHPDRRIQKLVRVSGYYTRAPSAVYRPGRMENLGAAFPWAQKSPLYGQKAVLTAVGPPCAAVRALPTPPELRCPQALSPCPQRPCATSRWHHAPPRSALRRSDCSSGIGPRWP